MTSGDFLTHWSARGAAICYVAAVLLQIMPRPAQSSLHSAARLAWSLGALLICLHVAFAMHFTYHWNHAQMVAETTRQTREFAGINWSGGAYVNYAFMLVWAGDALWWWLAGDRQYRNRPRWISIIVQAFLAFIAFNAVVVFAKTPLRWWGIAATLLVAAVAWRERFRPEFQS